MTNGEKYKTVQERAEAFYSFCEDKEMCAKCPFEHKHQRNMNECRFAWLDLEAEEEKPLPCPFCGNDKLMIEKYEYGSQVHCMYCGYRSIKCGVRVDPIAAHNRVAKAVKESEAKNG